MVANIVGLMTGGALAAPLAAFMARRLLQHALMFLVATAMALLSLRGSLQSASLSRFATFMRSGALDCPKIANRAFPRWSTPTTYRRANQRRRAHSIALKPGFV